MAHIWESVVDNKYQCSVTRTGEYEGQLLVTVMGSATVLLDKPVTLSYGAAFGPDVADVAEWQNLCLTAIDGPKDVA